MQENNEFIKINVVFDLPVKVAEQVAEMSAKIANQEDAYFVVDNSNFFAHITIYGPEYPKHNENEVLEIVGNLVKDFLPIKLVPMGFQVEAGYLGVEFFYSDEISKIHTTIVEGLNVLRKDHLREKYANDKNIPPEKMQNIKKYGQANLLDLYKPYVTITRLKDFDRAEKIAGEMEIPFEEFIVDKICAYKMGEHGTCVELMKEFSIN